MSFLLAIAVLVGLGALSGAGLALANRFFGVDEDPRLDRLCDALPGANCGACGYPGCRGYAQALLSGVDITSCAPGGNASVKEIARILGVEAQEVVEKIALVKCAGSAAMTGRRSEYRGIESCLAAHLVQAGPNDCLYGCLGLGSCVAACSYDAITLINGVAVVLPDRCIGDGACVSACPRDLIELVPKNRKAHVLCSNRQPGRQVRQICKVGCIACKLCAKIDSAYTVDDNLASIGPDAGDAACEAAMVCAPGTILDQNLMSAAELVSDPKARERLAAMQAEYKERKRAERAKPKPSVASGQEEAAGARTGKKEGEKLP